MHHVNKTKQKVYSQFILDTGVSTLSRRQREREKKNQYRQVHTSISCQSNHRSFVPPHCHCVNLVKLLWTFSTHVCVETLSRVHERSMNINKSVITTKRYDIPFKPVTITFPFWHVTIILCIKLTRGHKNHRIRL